MATVQGARDFTDAEWKRLSYLYKRQGAIHSEDPYGAEENEEYRTIWREIEEIKARKVSG